jgi:pimeloyl-ACP methyl ester carboxylesterase
MRSFHRVVVLLCVLFLVGCSIQRPNLSPTGPPSQVMQDFPDEVVKLYPERVSPSCATRGESCRRHALIFIHGLMGSSETWKNGHVYWPELLAADAAIEAFDIYRIDYETGLLDGAPISDIRRSLGRAMKASLGMRSYETIQFIAHSLGGIIVRDYLLYLKTGMGHGALNQFRQVFFIGSPAGGAYLAKIPRIMTNNPQLRILMPRRENDYLELLNEVWEMISKKRFEANCPSIFAQVAYEELPVQPLGIIVGRDSALALASATAEHTNIDVMGFARNHVDIVKPTGFNDPVYQWVKELILNCATGKIQYFAYCPKWDKLPPICQRPN